MPVIDPTTFKGLSDRLASQTGYLLTAFNQSRGSGTPYFPRVNATQDYDVENYLITPSNNLDNDTLSGTVLPYIFNSMIAELENQILAAGANNINDYMVLSGVEVHPNFEETYFRCKNTHLQARNVFYPNANLLLGNYLATSSGVGVFTPGTTLSTNPDADFDQNTSNYGPAKLLVVPIQTVSSDIQLDVHLTSVNTAGGSNSTSQQVSITAGTLSGVQFTVGGANKYLTCTNIVGAGGSGSNQFNLYALGDRVISM